MTNRQRGLWGSLLILMLALGAPGSRAESPGSAASATGSPTATVEKLHAALLEVMREATEFGYAGRREKLEPILTEVFDIPFMAQKSVGRHWKSVNEEKRAQLLDTFTRFTVANYAGRFDGYSGQQFETLGNEDSIRDTVLVHSQLVQEGDEPVQLNYRLRVVDGHWKIIDVYLNGTVSEIALRRSEYSALIQRDGFDALLAALDEKIADLAAAPADQS